MCPNNRWNLSLIALFFAVMPVQAESAVDFARDVQPLLAEKCVRCHGPKKQEGGLRLDIRRLALAGGDSGPAIVVGSASKSDLVKRLTTDDDHKRMPPTGKALSAEQVSVLKTWIDGGAVWPDELAGKESTVDHWAFRPVQRPQPPAVRNEGWVRSPIDRFILARLERANIAPAPEADRAVLIRRLYLDLVGLLPTPKEVETFVADARPDAWDRLVERLLASPHYGERWGRHWLDLARYAESDGYENDVLRPDAFRYRDWVVGALNRDLPYDQFTIEQLAGDLLPGATDEQKIATGLHRNTLYNSASSADKEEFLTYAVKDRVDTTAAIWLGLTFGCAKCHSHKYDPIAQREYYAVYAFFNNTDHHELPVPGGKALTLKAAKRMTHVHLRGNFLQRGEKVEPATPRFLPPLTARGQQADRLDLAQWLVDAKQPLPARVAVNRIWQHLFGKPLVPTPDNFGLSGQPPSHPELLDWLAAEFVAKGWSQKQLIRTIVQSSAYRQSARIRPELLSTDPDNRLLARQHRFRVEAEIVRDLALSASGLLDRTVGGPSIVPPVAKDFINGFGAEAWKKPTPERHRRSIYIHVQRTLIHPVLSALDPADPNQPCAQRTRSCTPMQALTLLNDPTFSECASALGRRLTNAEGDPDARLVQAFQLCLGRTPTAAELAILRELVAQPNEAAWTGVARTLLNLEAFTTRE